jgi:hypothetical protein
VQERENKGFMVSVIIPAHNYAAYLPRAIKSCLDQSHRRLETIVVDDGSTDDTKDIVHTFGDRVVYLFQKNSGVSSARNAGLDRAAGDFIAFLDADDYLTEGSLEIRLNAFLKDPDVDFVVANTYSRRMNDGSLACHSALRKDFVSDKIDRMLLSRHLPFATCSVLMRSHVAKQFRFPLHLANGEDIAYFTKIFFGRKGSFLSQPVAAVCSHTDSLRHRMDEIGKQGSALVDTIFNDPYYHGVLEYLRNDFTAYRYLEFFRRFYCSGDREAARRCLAKAIGASPRKIFKIDYLIKLIRLYVRKTR